MIKKEYSLKCDICGIEQYMNLENYIYLLNKFIICPGCDKKTRCLTIKE
jgi:hypothetical protein